MLSHITSALDKNNCNTELQPGFYSEHSAESNAFSIHVDGLGEISFPLDKNTINQLLSSSLQAKFGKRDQTLMDKNIRDSWEISADKLHITWDSAVFTAMLKRIGVALGLPEHAHLTAHLHNMLLYGEGQFFKEHQDSEKLDNMVASLIIVLPSPHIGGDLLIRHHGTEHRFISENLDTSSVRCIAFYADCYHEVEKIKQGTRVALTYNLVLEQDEPARIHYNNPSLEKALSDYFRPDTGSVSTQKLAYFLDHSYTQHSLRWNMLKGEDGRRAQVLCHAAEKLHLIPHLALVEIHESWDTEEAPYSYRYQKHSHQTSDDEIELGELIESGTELSYFLDKNNQPLPYKPCHINASEQCWSTPTNELKPDESEYEGWMGNYGNTMDYWYRRAAVVLWRKEDHLTISFELNYEHALEALVQLTKTPGNEGEVRNILTKAGKYLYKGIQYPTPDSSKEDYFPAFADIALYINDALMAKTVMSMFTIRALALKNTNCLVMLQKHYGVSWCLEQLTIWQTTTWGRVVGYLPGNILQPLLAGWLDNGIDTKIITHLLCYHVDNMFTNDKQYANNKLGGMRKSLPQRMVEAKALLSTSFILPAAEISRKIISHITQYPSLYPIEELAEWRILLYKSPIPAMHQDVCRQFMDYVSSVITEELAHGMRPRDDWSITAAFPCNCQHCNSTLAFLASSHEQSKTFAIVAHEREHVMGMFCDMELPVNLSVLKQGSPHKLVMEKHPNLHRNAQKRFEMLQSYHMTIQSFDTGSIQL